MVYIFITSCSASKDDSVPIRSDSHVFTPHDYLDDESLVSRLLAIRENIFLDPRAQIGKRKTYAYNLYVRAGNAYSKLFTHQYDTIGRILTKDEKILWFFLSGGYGIINALECAKRYQATFNRNIAYQNNIPYTTKEWNPILPRICNRIFQKYQPEWIYVFGSRDYTQFIKDTAYWKNETNITIFESTGISGVYWLATLIEDCVNSIIKDNADQFNSKYEKFNKQAK